MAVKRRTLAEQAEFLSADEAALALGMHQRALKRRIKSGAITPPAKYTEEGRYLFTAAEVERAREELGGKPMAILERARDLAATNLNAMAQIGALQPNPDLLSPAMKQMQEIAKRFATDDAFRAQFAAQDELAKNLMKIANSPAVAMQEIAIKQARQLEGIARDALRFNSTAKWISDMERTAQWMGEIEARANLSPPVPPGQVAAFPDEEVGDSDSSASLDDVLAELRKTNQLLQTLVDQSHST